jgi:phosphopantothenoylcysteine synthetase/decarboxylase
LLGPAAVSGPQQGYELVRFKFYDELSKRITKLLRKKPFDIIIHSAAVSDFRPEQAQKRKIHSGKAFQLSLSPLPKISERIARLKKKARLVLFKLETGLSDKELFVRAYKSLQDARADLVVANQLDPYRAFILNARGNKVSKKLRSKQEMSEKLIELLGAK